MGARNPRPEQPIRDSGYIEIVATTDATISANEYSNSVAADVVEDTTTEQASGEILHWILLSTDGDIATPAGRIHLFDTDPNISAGDATMTAGEAATELGAVTIASGDWNADTNSARATQTTRLAFPSLATIYLVFFLDAGESFAADDRLRCRFFWRKG